MHPCLPLQSDRLIHFPHRNSLSSLTTHLRASCLPVAPCSYKRQWYAARRTVSYYSLLSLCSVQSLRSHRGWWYYSRKRIRGKGWWVVWWKEKVTGSSWAECLKKNEIRWIGLEREIRSREDTEKKRACKLQRKIRKLIVGNGQMENGWVKWRERSSAF